MHRRYEDHRLKSSRGASSSGFLSALAIALSLFIAAPAAFASPPSAPRATRLTMKTVSRNGQKWVRSSTEIHAVFPVPLEAYKTMLLDAAAYPRFVPHLAAVDLFKTRSGVPAMRQRFEVKILGFTFTSIFATTIEPEDSGLPHRWRLAWTFVDSDGTVGGTTGYWELEDVSENGEYRVLVRHVNDGLVRKKYPFQTTIMRMVGDRELSAALLSGYREVLRRWPELNASSAKYTNVEDLPSYRKAEGSED